MSTEGYSTDNLDLWPPAWDPPHIRLPRARRKPMRDRPNIRTRPSPSACVLPSPAFETPGAYEQKVGAALERVVEEARADHEHAAHDASGSRRATRRRPQYSSATPLSGASASPSLDGGRRHGGHEPEAAEADGADISCSHGQHGSPSVPPTARELAAPRTRGSGAAGAPGRGTAKWTGQS